MNDGRLEVIQINITGGFEIGVLNLNLQVWWVGLVNVLLFSNEACKSQIMCLSNSSPHVVQIK